MTVHIEDIVTIALAQKGDEYQLGAVAGDDDPDPHEFDCSKLVQWSCARFGVAMPRTAFLQWERCGSGKNLSVDDARKIRGALVFTGDGTGEARNAITHVAISLGDGNTVEALNETKGVISLPIGKRFNFAGLIPGVSYEEDDMYDAPARDELVKRLDKIQGGIDEIFKKAIQEEAIIKKLDAAIDGLDDKGGLTKADVKAAVAEALAGQ
jgi:hypothetical protein